MFQKQNVKQLPIHVNKTAGLNDPCRCGSGKKFKNCHAFGKTQS